jgi:hypothetical protein
MLARHYNHIDILEPIVLRAVADGEAAIGVQF